MTSSEMGPENQPPTSHERFEELRLRYERLGEVVGPPPNFDPEDDE